MIIGAGLAGMVAGYIFPHERIYEGRDRDWVEHQAVLRFRTPAIGELTGIPFRKVTVHKDIWWRGRFVPPSISVANMYAQKTIGRLEDRSIWNIADVERWIAPPNFRARMADALGDRIKWGHPVNIAPAAGREPIISTIPLPAILKALPAAASVPPFAFAAISTTRIELVGADVFQTVYFPSARHPLYRASITGSTLILEWADARACDANMKAQAALDVEKAFGIQHLADVVEASEPEHRQDYGKIAPIDEVTRRSLILGLTRSHGIYSLGRFATWRNILLDDVLHDALMIKRLLVGADEYDKTLGR